MASGYTSPVADGTVTDFRTFALRCARGIDYCVGQREDSFHDLPKPREVSDHHPKAIEESNRWLETLAHMTLSDIQERIDQEYEAECYRLAKRREEKEQMAMRYGAMLVQVDRWNPPSADHAGLKEFMIQQLEESIRFDTGWTHVAPRKMRPAEWLSVRLEMANKDIAYHTEQYEKEKESVAKQNAWIALLYESLPTP